MMTLNFHNDLGHKDLYLFFLYADSKTSGVTNFSNKSYVQPWKDGVLALTDPFVCSFDWINSGTFWYMVTNETGASTIEAHPTLAMGTADKNWVGGFFELTSLEADNQVYFDVTNVDQMGLLCGVKFSNGKKCGYGLDANNFISGLETACNLASGTSAKVSITGTDGNSYTKLFGPTVPSVSDQYNETYVDYIAAIKSNNTSLKIESDSTSSSPHGGTQLPAFTFNGAFGSPESMPEGSPITADEVVLWFSCDDCTTAGETTYIFFTKDAINGGTIMSGNSAKGMYIYPAFEYTDPGAADPAKIIKGGWANDKSLNWTGTGANAVVNTTCFMAMISSIGRDIVTAMNLGYVGVTSAHNAFTYKDSSTYASAATQAEYINSWNKFITDNSDSYGMAYSDGTHAKVQFHPPVDGTIDCHILKQDDVNTKDYWSKTKDTVTAE